MLAKGPEDGRGFGARKSTGAVSAEARIALPCARQPADESTIEEARRRVAAERNAELDLMLDRRQQQRQPAGDSEPEPELPDSDHDVGILPPSLETKLQQLEQVQAVVASQRDSESATPFQQTISGCALVPNTVFVTDERGEAEDDDAENLYGLLAPFFRPKLTLPVQIPRIFDSTEQYFETAKTNNLAEFWFQIEELRRLPKQRVDTFFLRHNWEREGGPTTVIRVPVALTEDGNWIHNLFCNESTGSFHLVMDQDGFSPRVLRRLVVECGLIDAERSDEVDIEDSPAVIRQCRDLLLSKQDVEQLVDVVHSGGWIGDNVAGIKSWLLQSVTNTAGAQDPVFHAPNHGRATRGYSLADISTKLQEVCDHVPIEIMRPLFLVQSFGAIVTLFHW